MKIDILKVVDEVDRYLFKRMDLTEAQIKSLSLSFLFLSSVTTAYMLLNTRYLKKQNEKLRLLKKELEGFKNAKGE